MCGVAAGSESRYPPGAAEDDLRRGGAVFAVSAVLAGIIATDFNKYFIIFHHIFFNNDLWMLNPDTDLLINIVPEPFFMDTAARIAATYGVSVLTQYLQFVSLSCIIRRKRKRAKNVLCTVVANGEEIGVTQSREKNKLMPDPGSSQKPGPAFSGDIEMKRILTLLLCIVLITGNTGHLAYAAPEWPSNVSVEAEGLS